MCCPGDEPSDELSPFPIRPSMSLCDQKKYECSLCVIQRDPPLTDHGSVRLGWHESRKMALLVGIKFRNEYKIAISPKL